MELHQLKVFATVARTLSFTESAAVLNYAQSSVTAQVRALEKELGKPLFNRFGRQVQLTDAGKQMLCYADQLLNLAEQARASIANNAELTGAISIGAPETICTYYLPGLLREFRIQYPLVHVSFRPMEDADLPRGLKSGAIDIAFLLREPMASNGLLVEPLTTETLLVLSAPEHALARAECVEAHDLVNETLLLTEGSCGYRHLFERALARQEVSPLHRLEMNSIEALKRATMAGLGIAFLPRVAVANELAQGSLTIIPFAESFEVQTQLVWHKDTWLSLPLQAFLELTRQNFAASQKREQPQ